MRAERVRLTRDKQGNQTLQAEGSPVKFGQQLENKGYVEGQGNRAEYSSASNMIRLSGNAKVQRGGDVAQGEVITYNTKSEVYTVLGSKAAGTKSGRRVSVIIQPSAK